MTKKNIIIANVSAIVHGAVLGLLIGLIGGFFTSSDESTSASQERLTVEEEQQKEKEEDKAAKEAAKDVVADENGGETTDDAAASDDDQTDSQSDSQTDSNTTADNNAGQQQNTATTDNNSENTANAIGTGTVATGGSGLNLRASDSAQSNIVGSLNDGASVTIIGESNGMYQVQLSDGTTGWVSSQYVAMN